MGIWRKSKLDAILAAMSIAQAALMFWLASIWEGLPTLARLCSLLLLVITIVYNIIVISHTFAHAPWFKSTRLNGLMSLVNSINIGQSMQSYHLAHVRNHHRYNNDAGRMDGTTKDLSSTYRDGFGGGHTSVFRYAFLGAAATLLDVCRELLLVTRQWRVGVHESKLLALASRATSRRRHELRQVQVDRIGRFFCIAGFLLLSWRWTLECYLPAFFLALVLVNVQNYYEHYGAAPGCRWADSVSYYGSLYNLVAFNDGYHQEHHLRPMSHWTELPAVRERNTLLLNQVERVISPVPAILGFLHRGRPLLHHRAVLAALAAGPEAQ